MGNSGKRTRILQLISTFGTGGTEQGLINLLNWMQGSDLDFELCLLNSKGSEESLARVSDSKLRVHNLEKRFGNDPRVVVRLARLLKRGRFDVVHSRGWPTYLETGAALMLARRPRAVHSEHGTSFLDSARRRRAFGALHGRWERFLFVSNRLRDQFQEATAIPAGKMCVIPNGVDFDRFAAVVPDPEVAEKFDPDFFHIGTAGRFHDVKNHRVMLEAALYARAQGRRWKFHFAGDGDLRGEYERYVTEAGLKDYVVFHSTLRRIESFYAKLDLFALTSRSEGHPNALLEALAARVPVVSTPVGDVGEFLRDGETGFLFPQSDSAALCRVIERACADREALATVAAAGHAAGCATYRIDTMMESYASLYRELAAVPS